MTEPWDPGDPFADQPREAADVEAVGISLPPDIEAAWGQTAESRNLAVALVAEWGPDEFRASILHRLRLTDLERSKSFHTDAKKETRRK